MTSVAALNEMAVALDRSASYRVLERLVPRLSWGPPPETVDDPVRLMVVHVDAFQVDSRINVARLAYIVADFDPATGTVWHVARKYEGLHDPRRPIPDAFTSATGLNAASLQGQLLDRARVENDLATVNLIISHQAGKDRAALESMFPAVRHQLFACSGTSMDWSAVAGTSSHDLDLLLARLAQSFVPELQGLARVEALLHLLACTELHTFASSGQPLLLKLLDSTRQRTYRVWLDDSVFAQQPQALVSVGFRPTRKEVDPRTTAPTIGWALEVADLEKLLGWLERMGIRAGVVVDVMTARERFSRRFRSQLTPVYDVESATQDSTAIPGQLGSGRASAHATRH